MSQLKQPTIVVFCGAPASGKTTIAAPVAAALDLRIIDSDATREFIWGSDHVNWEQSEELAIRNRRQFMTVYDVIHRIVAGHCMLGTSIIVTMTYTNAASWKFLQESMKDYPLIALKVIWCSPSDVSQKAIEKRLEDRNAAGYRGWAGNYGKVRLSVESFAPVPVSHLKLDTSVLSIEEEVRRSIDYITS